MLTAALVLGSGQIYNVGGETATTIRDLGALIAQTLGVEFVAPVDDGHTSDNSPKTVSLDITKIKNLSGKSSFLSIEDGVQETVIWFKKIHEGQT
jgi:nucleoside-diphosphate-sugar epimerase